MKQTNEILQFWFGDYKDFNHYPVDKANTWFQKSTDFDESINKKFGPLVDQAKNSELLDWTTETPYTCLAYILLLDQFTRNIYRNQPQAFAHDELARTAANGAITKGFDKQLPLVCRVFMYLPFEHSEDKNDHPKCIELFQSIIEVAPEDQKERYKGYLSFAQQHKDIIDRFGRYPHRNKILNRVSTTEEIEFLETPGSSF